MSERKIRKLKINVKRTRWLMKLKNVDLFLSVRFKNMKNVNIMSGLRIKKNRKTLRK